MKTDSPVSQKITTGIVNDLCLSNRDYTVLQPSQFVGSTSYIDLKPARSWPVFTATVLFDGGKSIVGIFMTTAGTVTKFTDCIEHSGVFRLFMLSGFVIRGMTARTIRFVRTPSNDFTITLVTVITQH